jgi:hypothetical protein
VQAIPDEEARLFLQSLDIDEAGYTREYGKTIANMQSMGKAPSREDRLSPVLGLRIAVMSGLSWNEDSKSKHRDWFMQATAITIETLLIPRYRGFLLAKCPGARILRYELQEYFASITAPYFLQRIGEGPTSRQEWFFPDNLTTQPDPPVVYDPDDLASRFEAVEAGTEDTIADWVDLMENHRLLQCSSESGKLESLAHDAIVTMAHVSVHSEFNWAI